MSLEPDQHGIIRGTTTAIKVLLGSMAAGGIFAAGIAVGTIIGRSIT